MIVSLGILSAIAVGLFVYVVYTQYSRDSLPNWLKSKLERQWKHAVSITDPSSRVLEAEKVIDQLFIGLGYDGTFGNKLKEIGPRLKNEQAVWNAHKLRNKIAHEPGFTVTKKESDVALKAFSSALSQFL